MKKRSHTAKAVRASARLAAWGQSFDRARVHEVWETSFIEDYFANIDTPVSLSCYMQWKYGEHDDLARRSVNPLHYKDHLSFELDYRAVCFLAKDPGLRTSWDRQDVAKRAFLDAESRCGQTNREFYAHLYHGKSTRFIEKGFGSVFERMRRLIQRTLGEFDITEFFECGTWGPGATLKTKGRETASCFKFDGDCDITPSAYHLFYKSLQAFAPNWLGGVQPNFVRGNKVIFVPKNAKTHRTIAVEAGLNSWLQLAAGKMIRKRLRAVLGIDLNSDLVNQGKARLGSLLGTVATIDFRAASDTISYRLVEALLPHSWWVVLRALRSPEYLLDGQYSMSEKFSSMGCGFTFELESLIFVTAALAICESLRLPKTHVSVFGDDITLPTEAALNYCEFVQTLGFSVNLEKSFISGPFRESCGSYYYAGYDTKPIYKKGKYQSMRELFKLANSLRLLAHRRMNFCHLDRSLYGLWLKTVSAVPKRFQLFGPREAGDAVIHVGKYEELGPPRHTSPKSFGGVYPIVGAVSSPVKTWYSGRGLIFAHLSQQVSNADDPFKAWRDISERRHYASARLRWDCFQKKQFNAIESLNDKERNWVTLRNATRTKKTRLRVTGWYDFGLWL